MPKALTWILFVFVFIIATSAIHFYLYRRLVKDARLPKDWSLPISAFFMVMVVSIPISRLVSKFVSPQVVGYLVTPILTWMGISFILFVIWITIDIVRGTFALGRYLKGNPTFGGLKSKGGSTGFMFHQMTDFQLENSSRRVLIQRGMAAATSVGTLAVSGAGIDSAFGEPAINFVNVKLKNLPLQFEGFKIAQISDLHIGPTIGNDFVKKVIELTNRHSPDLVALTGDFVDGPVSLLGPTVELLKDLRSPMGSFFVTGNHEYYSGAPQWVDFISSLGIKVLRNEHVKLYRDQAILQIAGVDDWNADIPGHSCDHQKAIENCSRETPIILLAHQPRGFDTTVRLGIDYQLSGHTHGGQIWPFGLFVKLLQPYVSGLHREGESQIYVSNGTGFWGPAIRVGAPPEIVMHVLERA